MKSVKIGGEEKHSFIQVEMILSSIPNKKCAKWNFVFHSDIYLGWNKLFCPTHTTVIFICYEIDSFGWETFLSFQSQMKDILSPQSTNRPFTPLEILSAANLHFCLPFYPKKLSGAAMEVEILTCYLTRWKWLKIPYLKQNSIQGEFSRSNTNWKR